MYQDGDTWYRDMRDPGFGDLNAPNSDNSVQWLAQQIVADDRFAEAAVRFWWQPIMGVDILDAPTDSSDPDYQGRSVAAAAQAAEVARLATAFRTGIDGGSAYNGKDLLTEIALSSWFRAESMTSDDPVRTTALRDAGMARLLTPEELNRKTDAVARYVWGRHFRDSFSTEVADVQSNLDIRYWDTHALLYGGIDSDGVITRATDMTPVMAAVAQSHAVEVSCPIVRREFFLWNDADRLLFDGIDRFDSPVSESHSQFDVTAHTWETRQAVSLEVALTAGSKTILLAFTNDYNDEESGLDRNLSVDRMTVLDSAGTAVSSIEFESLDAVNCAGPNGSAYTFWCASELSTTFEIQSDDVYQIEVVAYQDRAGDDPARMSVTVESDDGVSAGATAIRHKLVDLHLKLFGVEVAPDSPDVNEAFDVFFEVWSRIRQADGDHFDSSQITCDHDDQTYFDGLVDDPLSFTEWESIRDLYENADMSDPRHAVRAWVNTLIFLMTDYRYLYF